MIRRLLPALMLPVLATFCFVSPAHASGATSSPTTFTTCSAAVTPSEPAMVPSLKFNPCANLDLHQIEDCRGKVCYRYCTTGKELRICHLRPVLVPIWKEYRVGHKPAGCR